MERPATPPQVISAGDLWSSDIEIWLDGALSGSKYWTQVDAVAGIGSRYRTNRDGELVVAEDGQHLLLEEVQGQFEVRWRRA